MNPLHVMAKPSSSKCNIDCEYCFYLEKEKLYPDQDDYKMSYEVLEAYIKQTITSQQLQPHYEFSWQGGEPTLLGLDFFKHALVLQAKYSRGKLCYNSFQTNGILLNDDWCRFFAAHGFLIGLSIDGNASHHDAYRKTRSGKGTHAKVLNAVSLLKKHKVEFNAMTVIHKANVNDALAVYRALLSYGIQHIQLTPLVERQTQQMTPDGLTLVSPDFQGQSQVSEWSISGKEYGQFLCAMFDEWKKQDIGKVFIYTFENAIAMSLDMPGRSCVMNETCGTSVALESNGDIYSCDHFVYPEHKIGNLMTTSLTAMAGLQQQIEFGLNKKTNIAVDCKTCPHLKLCHGGCPKQRFDIASDGKPNKNYLCDGYKMFFGHAKKPIAEITKVLGF